MNGKLIAPGAWQFVRVYNAIMDANGNRILEVVRGYEEVGALVALAPDLLKALKDMEFAYINKDADCPHDFELKALVQAETLITRIEGKGLL